MILGSWQPTAREKTQGFGEWGLLVSRRWTTFYRKLVHLLDLAAGNHYQILKSYLNGSVLAFKFFRSCLIKILQQMSSFTINAYIASDVLALS